MTAVGGLGHTLPFLIGSFHAAILVAMIVVGVELIVISYIRHRYMDTQLLSSAVQVIVGGALVFRSGDLDRKFVDGEGYSSSLSPRTATATPVSTVGRGARRIVSMNTRTMTGSNWFAAQRSSSANASSGVRAFL
jgi:hypothetical protein